MERRRPDNKTQSKKPLKGDRSFVNYSGKPVLVIKARAFPIYYREADGDPTQRRYSVGYIQVAYACQKTNDEWTIFVSNGSGASGIKGTHFDTDKEMHAWLERELSGG